MKIMDVENDQSSMAGLGKRRVTWKKVSSQHGLLHGDAGFTRPSFWYQIMKTNTILTCARRRKRWMHMFSIDLLHEISHCQALIRWSVGNNSKDQSSMVLSMVSSNAQS